MPRSNSSGLFSFLPPAALSHLWSPEHPSMCCFPPLWLRVSCTPSKVGALWPGVPGAAEPILPVGSSSLLALSCSPRLLCLTSLNCLGKPSLMPVLDAQFWPPNPLQSISKHHGFHAAPCSPCQGCFISQTAQRIWASKAPLQQGNSMIKAKISSVLCFPKITVPLVPYIYTHIQTYINKWYLSAHSLELHWVFWLQLGINQLQKVPTQKNLMHPQYIAHHGLSEAS